MDAGQHPARDVLETLLCKISGFTRIQAMVDGVLAQLAIGHLNLEDLHWPTGIENAPERVRNAIDSMPATQMRRADRPMQSDWS